LQNKWQTLAKVDSAVILRVWQGKNQWTRQPERPLIRPLMSAGFLCMSPLPAEADPGAVITVSNNAPPGPMPTMDTDAATSIRTGSLVVEASLE